MKTLIIFILFIPLTLPVYADHVKGGSIYYEYLGNGISPNTSKYRITVKQYSRCDAKEGQYNKEVFLGIFDGTNNQLIQTDTLPISSTEFERNDFNCITSPQEICYRIDKFDLIIELPQNNNGYTLSVQQCCRIFGIVNLDTSNLIGFTSTIKIPGPINGQSYRNNSTPIFAQKDTEVICKNAFFNFDFSATDADGDSLSYEFIDGLSSYTISRPNPPILPPPPYIPNDVLPYSTGYSGTSPFGTSVTINPSTGIVSGIAPNTTGSYAVAVAANEYRKGVLIGTARKEIQITVADCHLPVVSIAKKDTAICFGNLIQLHASGGNIYSWSPKVFLNNPNIPDPISKPDKSIRYIVTISDTLSCSKSITDTVEIYVQRIFADAGPRDTSIVANQPLKLNATGGQFYSWSPATGLNNPNIPNPVANLTDNINYIVRVSNALGCFATDTISIKVYKVIPGLYVPSAFTPNGDGINDVVRPIPIGMKKLNYFKIFKRYGDLIFSTTEYNKGWDGKFKGRPQDADVYVWIAEGIDYKNNKLSEKGTVTLIR